MIHRAYTALRVQSARASENDELLVGICSSNSVSTSRGASLIIAMCCMAEICSVLPPMQWKGVYCVAITEASTEQPGSRYPRNEGTYLWHGIQ